LEIVVIVVGTEDDPQDLHSQVERLARAGAVVFRNVTEAVAHITGRLGHRASNPGPPVALDRFAQTPLAVINVGLELFYESLLAQGAQAVQVDWRPPAAGNERLASLLTKMRK
jgi:FdrA protein